MRFWRTFQAVTMGAKYPSDRLISISSKIPALRKLCKELGQPTMGKSTKLKLIVDKTPEGTKSPNLGDATMMCFWPSRSGATGFLDLFESDKAALGKQRKIEAESDERAPRPPPPTVAPPSAWIR
jgi:hypothetical protein